MSYPKLYTLGHGAIKDIFLNDVEVEEKVDGSQFSWGVIDGELQVRSKNCRIYDDNVPTLFRGAVATARRTFEEGLLTPGWMYRGEAMQSAKHNTLAYDRAPKGNVILFDVMTGPDTYIQHAEKSAIAEKLGLEVVPLIFKGKIEYLAGLMHLKALLDRMSILGGQKIEGLVFKNYERWGIDGKPLFGKYVSEAFKEVHQGEWKKTAPAKKDIIEALIAKYTTPARWNKAIVHMKEEGKLTNSPTDIGPLMGAIAKDVHAECKEEIAAVLFEWGWKQISRGVVKEFPTWYKEELAKSQFEGAA